ncbi:4-oxalocrotonate tautomerase family protein [Streptomyces venezuelae]|uniref:4-oxalocrotonate tautomerase family protein n=1 Tax=Streptomyces venezuelae TaxID=54571 RepID=UPI00378BA5DB
MPVVTVDWWSGFGPEERRDLSRRLTASVVAVTGCRPDSVTVIIRDVERDHWARGGVLADERSPRAAEPGPPSREERDEQQDAPIRPAGSEAEEGPSRPATPRQ